MVSRSKYIHRCHASLLAVLFLTLTLAVWAQDSAKSSPDPTPGAGPGQTPGIDLPEKPKPVVPPSAVPLTSPPPPDNAPVQLPVVKPVVIHADRDAAIGRVAAVLLEHNHYLQKPISPEMSQRWLKNYFDALDYNHLFFLQSDIDEFTARDGNGLGELLLHGDTEE